MSEYNTWDSSDYGDSWDDKLESMPERNTSGGDGGSFDWGSAISSGIGAMGNMGGQQQQVSGGDRYQAQGLDDAALTRSRMLSFSFGDTAEEKGNAFKMGAFMGVPNPATYAHWKLKEREERLQKLTDDYNRQIEEAEAEQKRIDESWANEVFENTKAEYERAAQDQSFLDNFDNAVRHLRKATNANQQARNVAQRMADRGQFNEQVTDQNIKNWS